MKLVGASWGFIRRPFLRRAMLMGVVVGIDGRWLSWEDVSMLGIFTSQNCSTVLGWQELAITGGSVFLFGIIITALCASISVNKFLKMKAGDLYKI